MGAADLKNDTKPDVIFISRDLNTDNDNSVLLFHRSCPTTSGPHALAIGDVIDDRAPDTIVANLDSNDISVILSQC
jgi:hypothetical protein